ncbi:MAG: UDP-N-acetylmuramoyl-L-alanyl-D-glutamate--2,6-diaminopimelate ligase [Clostridiales bacterium]|nr:UDP-N-acetylmuramoyl-L-alanyl-D-glutamate--2,6-diaminopimelate ligase [Clostridiales bacterium]
MLLYGKSEISAICYDSRKAAPGAAFFCLVGVEADGHDYAYKAYEKGCRVFVAEKPLELPDDAEVYIVEDSRKALGDAAAEFYSHADKKLRLIGVTGTKGKTSVATFIAEALNQSGQKCGFIGTTGTIIDGVVLQNANTTPERAELHRIFAEMVSHGCVFCVMEVSSQAEKTGRVDGLNFEAAAFANLSPDHISPREHATFEDYRDCKAKLFSRCGVAVINADDENASFMAENAGDVVLYGVENKNALSKEGSFIAENPKKERADGHLGAEFDCFYPGGRFHIKTTVPGRFSVYNALCAAAVCRTVGVAEEHIVSALDGCQVPGRFEEVKTPLKAKFIIDYAHNEVSLESALRALKELRHERLIVLFGCIGGRAQMRREPMGKIAAELADFLILTSDNPDREPPMQIIAGIERGIVKADRHPPYVRFADRADAVRYAVRISREGDIILFAGKGHENYQIIDGKHVHFSEREIIEEEALELRG